MSSASTNSISSFFKKLFGISVKSDYINHGFGWLHELPDIRDHKFTVMAPLVLPLSVDLRDGFSLIPVYDQGQLGSCTANAIAGAMEYDLVKQHSRRVFPPSRLFIYYNERDMEGTISYDSGAYIRDGMKSIADLGCGEENLWKYDISKFTQRPPSYAYKNARRYKAVDYQRLDNTDIVQLKSCLSSGYPFVFGFTVYESFESQQVAQTGIVPFPQPHERVIGGHAVVCVGYDDAKQMFICRNSWGPNWGDRGYFYMPYSYLTSSGLANDFWKVTFLLIPT